MTQRYNELVANALDEWRMTDMQRDWGAVLGAAKAPVRVKQKRRRRWISPRVTARHRLAIATGAVSLLVITGPALAVITDTVRWPWTSGPGLSLAASVSTPGTTAELRLASRGGRLYRVQKTSTSKILAPLAATRKRRFRWQLTTEGGNVAAAQILIDGQVTRLCKPCGPHQAGAFNLSGRTALDVLNGHARLSVEIAGQTLSDEIRLSS